MKKILLFLSIQCLLASSAQSMQTEIFKNITTAQLKNTCLAATIIIGGYVILNPIVAHLHALSHKVALKSLLNTDSIITTEGEIRYQESQMPKTGLRKAICFAAGPLAGIATAYSLSILLRKVGQLYFNTNPTVTSFNNTLNISIKILFNLLIAKQMINFIPLEFNAWSTTDGYKIFQALGIIE